MPVRLNAVADTTDLAIDYRPLASLVLTPGTAGPMDELLAAELTGPMYSYNAANALLLEPKADMKRRGIPSPDVADAFALTFAYNVARWEEPGEPLPDYGRSSVTGY